MLKSKMLQNIYASKPFTTAQAHTMPKLKNIMYHQTDIMTVSFAFSGLCSKVAKARKSKGKVCTLSLLQLSAKETNNFSGSINHNRQTDQDTGSGNNGCCRVR